MIYKYGGFQNLDSFEPFLKEFSLEEIKRHDSCEIERNFLEQTWIIIFATLLCRWILHHQQSSSVICSRPVMVSLDGACHLLESCIQFPSSGMPNCFLNYVPFCILWTPHFLFYRTAIPETIYIQSWRFETLKLLYY